MATDYVTKKPQWPYALRDLVRQPVPTTPTPPPSAAFRAGRAVRDLPGNIDQAANSFVVGRIMDSINAGRALQRNVIDPTVGAVRDFSTAVSGGNPPPTPVTSAPLAPPAPLASGASVLQRPAPEAPVAAPVTGTPAPPSAGPNLLAQQRNTAPDLYPNRAVLPARGGQPAATFTGPQVASLSARVNGGSYAPPALSQAAAPAVFQSGTRGNDGVSRAVQARGQMLDQLYQQALQRVNSNQLNSYGDLFDRKRDMNTLAQLGPLVQAGGSNVVQAAGDVLNANTAQRGQDINREGNFLSADTQRYGTDRRFESTTRGQDITREGNLLSNDTRRYGVDRGFESNQGQQATTLRGYMIQAQGAQAAAQQKAAQDAQKLAIQNPDYMLRAEAATGRTLNPDGTWRNLTPEEHAVSLKRWQDYKGIANPLDLLNVGK